MQKNKFTHEISLTLEDEKEIKQTQYRYKKIEKPQQSKLQSSRN